MITNFEDFMKINEDDGGGGCAMATNASGGGMGAIVSPTVSAIPGDVSGSIKGSGDIANSGFGPYSKQPLGIRRKKRKTKK